MRRARRIGRKRKRLLGYLWRKKEAPRRQECSDGNNLGGSSPPSPRTAPEPDPPSLSVQLPSPPPLSIQLSPHFLSLEKNCTPSQAPFVYWARWEDVSYDQIHQLCERRSTSRIDSDEAPKTRLAPKGAEGRKGAYTDSDAMDASATGTGKRGRAPDDAAETSGERLGNQGKRCRVGGLHPASVAQKEVLKGHTQLRNRDLKSRLDATQAPAAGGWWNVIARWARNGQGKRRKRMGTWRTPQNSGNSICGSNFKVSS